jgi:glycosyltransferase involved in cell wall biosynthesis
MARRKSADSFQANSGDRKPVGNLPPADPAAARIAILMCTKNGAAFIDDQLKSISQQSHHNWILIVSDDGSTDATLLKLQRFAETHDQKTIIIKGPGKGVCANFLSLANDCTINADYFAFSDQDDVWHQQKLQRALAFLAGAPAGVPAMYCGRTELMTVDEKPCGFSPLFTRTPAFQNALVENLGAGNTMVFNRATKKMLEQAATMDVVLHDWWVYQLVSAAGGIVLYDPQPMLKYRQHSANVIGSNRSWRARLTRLPLVLSGRFRKWNDININALRRLPHHLMREDNRTALELFTKARSASLLSRLYYLKRSGVYRQRSIDDLALFAAAVLKTI